MNRRWTCYSGLVLGVWLVGVRAQAQGADDAGGEAPLEAVASDEGDEEKGTEEGEAEAEAPRDSDVRPDPMKVDLMKVDPMKAAAGPARGADTGTMASPSAGETKEKGHKKDVAIPLRAELHGYFRTRLNWIGNVPVGSSALNDAEDAAYAFMRARLEPHVLYGSKKDSPIAAFKLQIDGFDNVVWGDNARIARTPLFAVDPSLTDVEGFDLGNSLYLKRAWIEFMIPVGQLRVGRMPSHWALGLLTYDGNGLGEWGDPMFGTTFDRILFATRPITIYNALAKGDARPTPLIFAFIFDKLVEDPINRDLDPPADLTEGPLSGTFEARRTTPSIQFLTDDKDDVNEVLAVLLWNDPEFNLVKSSDELTLGNYFVYRWQESTESDVFINDFFWRLRVGLGKKGPSFMTEGEFLTIVGESRGLSTTNGLDGQSCDDELCPKGDALIFGAVGSASVFEEDKWAAELEVGFSSGDGKLLADKRLKVRPLHPDYRVGLLMYQVALAGRTANGLRDPLRPLWSRGGVWNSKYFWPQVRYTLLPGIEAHAAFLVAWADELLPLVYVHERADFADTSCGFEGSCFIGWETDFALRFKWGDGDIMHWDTEAGFMKAGDALVGERSGLSEDFLWTVQTRIGMVF